jgi:uncharacterized protein YdaU (DUF1376 family)
MHYYPFAIGDYMAHTRHLSLLEDLAYRRLLDFYHLHENPPVGTISEVSREIGFSDEVKSVKYILNKFFTPHTITYMGKSEIHWKNKRCEETITKYKSRIASSKKGGKASAAQRDLKSTSTTQSPTKTITKTKTKTSNYKKKDKSEENDEAFRKYIK